jgi:hypothetical protein
MRINGDSPKLGNWNKGTGPVVMQRGKPRKWLTGNIIEPWELPKLRFTHASMPQKLTYKYSILNEYDDVIIWEREPSRNLLILEPSDYTMYKSYGKLPTDEKILEWRNTD